jgi:hypothetical protein
MVPVWMIPRHVFYTFPGRSMHSPWPHDVDLEGDFATQKGPHFLRFFLTLNLGREETTKERNSHACILRYASMPRIRPQKASLWCRDPGLDGEYLKDFEVRPSMEAKRPAAMQRFGKRATTGASKSSIVLREEVKNATEGW